MFTARQIRELEELMTSDLALMEAHMLDRLIILSVKNGHSQVQVWETDFIEYEVLMDALEEAGFTVKRHSNYSLITWN